MKHKWLRQAALALLLVAGITITSIFNSTTTKAEDLPVVQKSGTLASNETWEEGNVYLVFNTLTVPNGITLTIEDGAIVKYRYSNSKIAVASGGTLDVNGTSGSPVTFTSYKDDSAGGDTNNDGPSSGSANDYIYAVDGNGGTITAEYSLVQFAGVGLIASNSSNVTVEDSEFTDSQVGISLGTSTTQALLRRNHFAVDNLAIDVSGLNDVTGVVLAGPDKNTFTGGFAASTVRVRGAAKIPSGLTWTISRGTTGVVLETDRFSINGTLSLEDDALLLADYATFTVNGTLNLGPGTMVKYEDSGGGTPGEGITVASGGVMNANGTPSKPVIFTSQKDDSAGGDTNNDGSSNGAANDYAYAITGRGGTITLSHGILRFAGTAVTANNSSVVTITDSEFTDSWTGVDLSSVGAQTSLQRNHFSVAGWAVNISVLSDISGFVLTGADKNTFIGNGDAPSVRLRAATIPSDSTWTVSGEATGAILQIERLFVNGTLNLEDNALVLIKHYWPTNITVNGTLNAGADTILKYEGAGGGTPGNGVTVAAGGTLNINGTPTDPVIFTSAKDDSVGGDTNNDGLSSGTVDDYNLAIRGDDATVSMQHGVFKYVSTALDMNSSSYVTMSDSEFADSGRAGYFSNSQLLAENVTIENTSVAMRFNSGEANLANTTISDSAKGLEVTNSADVAFRGSFNNISNKAIEACNWDQNCAVDASYVDWGSADGPFPSAGDPLVCGKVMVSPWVYASNTYEGEVFSIENCNSSPTPQSELNTAISVFQQSVALEQIDCSNGFQDACDAIEAAMTCLGGAMSAAQSTSPWTIPPATTEQQIDDFGGLVLDSASSYISSQASVSVTGFSFGLITQLAGLLDTYLALDDAYSACAP